MKPSQTLLDLAAKNKKLVKDIRTLRKALKAAKEHLEYCNYGDNYERQCAIGEGLADIINEALEPRTKVSAT